MDRKKQDLLLGLVFFAGLGVLLWATMNVTGLSLGDQMELRTVRFAQSEGLQAGNNVFVLGHRLGQVQEIDYERDAPTGRRIKVVLRFDEPVTLTDRYRIRIREGSLLGGRQIDVDPGDGPTIIEPGRELNGEVALGALASIGDVFADGALGADLRAVANGLRLAIDRANRGEGTLGKVLTDPALHDELLAAAGSARRSLEELESGRGALGRIIYDQEVGDEMGRIITNVDSIVADARAGRGLLGSLLADEKMADDGRRILDDVAVVTTDLRGGAGALGLLMRDEPTRNELSRITGGFAQLADGVNNPELGLIGALVADPEMRANGQRVVDDLADVTTEIRSGNGLISRLLYDDEMGEQFSRVLTQVARAVEDAREAAPVGTFFSVFAGAF